MQRTSKRRRPELARQLKVAYESANALAQVEPLLAGAACALHWAWQLAEEHAQARDLSLVAGIAEDVAQHFAQFSVFQGPAWGDIQDALRQGELPLFKAAVVPGASPQPAHGDELLNARVKSAQHQRIALRVNELGQNTLLVWVQTQQMLQQRGFTLQLQGDGGTPGAQAPQPPAQTAQHGQHQGGPGPAQQVDGNSIRNGWQHRGIVAPLQGAA